MKYVVATGKATVTTMNFLQGTSWIFFCPESRLTPIFTVNCAAELETIASSAHVHEQLSCLPRLAALCLPVPSEPPAPPLFSCPLPRCFPGCIIPHLHLQTCEVCPHLCLGHPSAQQVFPSPVVVSFYSDTLI